MADYQSKAPLVRCQVLCCLAFRVSSDLSPLPRCLLQLLPGHASPCTAGLHAHSTFLCASYCILERGDLGIHDKDGLRDLKFLDDASQQAIAVY